jgi:translation initiation factor eIF-2B subunit epsilon
MGYKIYTHELRSGYAARIDNFRSYDTVSKDVIQRWTYPMVPDVISSGDCSESRLHRQGIYKASGICCLEFFTIGLFLDGFYMDYSSFFMLPEKQDI